MGKAAAADLRPPSDIHGSSDYRKELAGALVRRALGDAPDAEDAYQATFLVLARRAEVVRKIGRVSG